MHLEWQLRIAYLQRETVHIEVGKSIGWYEQKQRKVVLGDCLSHLGIGAID